MNNNIGNCITHRRTELGKTQQEIAKSVGTTQAYISFIESGRKTPSVSVLRLLADALELRMSELLGEK